MNEGDPYLRLAVAIPGLMSFGLSATILGYYVTRPRHRWRVLATSSHVAYAGVTLYLILWSGLRLSAAELAALALVYLISLAGLYQVAVGLANTERMSERDSGAPR